MRIMCKPWVFAPVFAIKDEWRSLRCESVHSGLVHLLSVMMACMIELNNVSNNVWFVLTHLLLVELFGLGVPFKLDVSHDVALIFLFNENKTNKISIIGLKWSQVVLLILVTNYRCPLPRNTKISTNIPVTITKIWRIPWQYPDRSWGVCFIFHFIRGKLILQLTFHSAPWKFPNTQPSSVLIPSRKQRII